MNQIIIVGAGFSGAVIARYFADLDYKVTVIDSRNTVAGNCYSCRDEETQIMLHIYGPHIFHTDYEEVWNYLQKFGSWKPFINRVKAVTNDVSGKKQVFSMPINLHTINQFFGKTFSPKEAQEFISNQADISIKEPKNFEEQALKFVGQDIYRAFFYGYTKRQWGVEPTQLPASILKRLPMRFNYNDNYFSHKFQAIPEDGYEVIVKNILAHKNIEVKLKTPFAKEMQDKFKHTFWSAPLDLYFNYEFGRLNYRSLDFEIIRDSGDFQGNAVINYCSQDVPYTRICEHKHFEYWRSFDKTIIYREIPKQCGENDIPYYPIRLTSSQKTLDCYIEKARELKNVTFVGRLGTYRYLDMDATIKEALNTAEEVEKNLRTGQCPDAFYVHI